LVEKDDVMKRVVVVGGGYAGFEIAKELDNVADVTLIEQREAFVHPPAAIRALVQPDLLDDIIFPYDNLLGRGRVVHARAGAVNGDEVKLENGDRIEADYVVVATGSDYATPFKPQGSSVADFIAAQKDVSAKLKAARSVIIVGAGAVGSELAGEIVAAQKGKEITLISSDDQLFPMYPKKMGAALQRKLEAAGVTVVLGQRAEDLHSTRLPYAGAVTLSDGRVLEADLIFPVIGSKPRTELLDGLAGVKKGSLGRVKTDRWLRPSAYETLFVAGDIADVGDGMTIVATARQNPWLVKTLKAVIGGARVQDQKPYAPWKKAPILVPLGPKIGNSWLFMTVGNFMTRLIKGKEIFIPKYKKSFGIKE
jgi:NADH dehydrogenase FAD-containing subunit